MKVIFTGAQGVGKTTLLDILEKCVTLPIKFNYVRNFTRNLAKAGYTINEKGTDDTQLAIMNLHKQYAEKDENIVMDRCVLDGLAYTVYLNRRGRVTDETGDLCEQIFKECIDKYDIIYYLKPEFPITGDEYRSNKIQYQSEIADIFEELIQKYSVKVTPLTGTVGDRLKGIQDTLGGIIKC